MSKKKVALVGFAPNTRNMAPWRNDEFEIWGCNELYLQMKIELFDRWYDIHKGKLVETGYSSSDHGRWLKKCPVPLYMQEHMLPTFPNARKFPVDEIIAKFGRDYFTNTIAFMLAHALYEGFEEIHIYGVDMLMGSEYEHQRPCCEFWVGIALGMGVKVHIPDESALLKQNFRYGYDVPPESGAVDPAFLQARYTAIEQNHMAAMREQAFTAGQAAENRFMLSVAEEYRRRGVKDPDFQKQQESWEASGRNVKVPEIIMPTASRTPPGVQAASRGGA